MRVFFWENLKINNKKRSAVADLEIDISNILKIIAGQKQEMSMNRLFY